MSLVVLNDGYKDLILNCLQTNNPLPAFSIEFYSGNNKYFTTQNYLALNHTQNLKTISLIAICDKDHTIAPCTHVLWKDDQGNIVYRVEYDISLPVGVEHICHIVLGIINNSQEDVGYYSVPTELLVRYLEPDYIRMAMYQLRKGLPASDTNSIPNGYFYTKVYDVMYKESPSNPIYIESNIEVNLSATLGNHGRLKVINQALYIETD